MFSLNNLKTTGKPKHRVIRNRTARRGVILVFVLLFLALCSAVLVRSHSLVTRSLLQAAQSEKELQNRWARVSLRRGLLMRSDSLLEVPSLISESTAREKNGLILATSNRLANWQVDLVLSGSRYIAKLEDENAKLPLNRLHASKNFELWRSEVRSLIAGHANLKQSLTSRKLIRWGDVFQASPDTFESSRQLAEFDGATKYITLFTNDLVNYRNAPTPVLNSLWRIYFSRNAPGCILDMRRIQSPFNIAQYCRANGLSEAESAFAEEVLSDTSRCTSLTISQLLGDGFTVTSRYYRRMQEGYADDQFGDPG